MFECDEINGFRARDLKNIIQLAHSVNHSTISPFCLHLQYKTSFDIALTYWILIEIYANIIIYVIIFIKRTKSKWRPESQKEYEKW